MNSSSTRRKYVIGFLLFNLTAFWINNLLNRHYHYHQNGELITHAHPHDHKEEHHHSDEEFLWLDNISQPNFQYTHFLTLEITLFDVYADLQTVFAAEVYQLYSHHCKAQRGPPDLAVFF